MHLNMSIASYLFSPYFSMVFFHHGFAFLREILIRIAILSIDLCVSHPSLNNLLLTLLKKTAVVYTLDEVAGNRVGRKLTINLDGWNYYATTANDFYVFGLDTHRSQESLFLTTSYIPFFLFLNYPLFISLLLVPLICFLLSYPIFSPRALRSLLKLRVPSFLPS